MALLFCRNTVTVCRWLPRFIACANCGVYESTGLTMVMAGVVFVAPAARVCDDVIDVAGGMRGGDADVDPPLVNPLTDTKMLSACAAASWMSTRPPGVSRAVPGPERVPD